MAKAQRKSTSKRGKKAPARKRSGKKKIATGKNVSGIAPKRAERGKHALKLRKKGMSWARVGAELGVSGSYARNCAADVAGGNDALPSID